MTVAAYPFRPVQSAEDTTTAHFSDFGPVPMKQHSLDELRALEAQTIAAAADNNLNIMRNEAGNEFVAITPEYLDTEANAQLMAWAVGKLGLSTTEVASFQTAFADLRANNLIKVDEEKAAEEQSKAARSRVRDEHGKFVANASLSDDQMYELDLDEIRARANAQLARR